MKLRYAAGSPYSRKCLVVAHEKGLAGRIELLAPDRADPSKGVSPENPLGKIPTLITDDGEALFDSPVITEYLDAVIATPRLLPASGNARWRVKRLEALADGLMDAAILVVYEGRRPEGERSAAWVTQQSNKVKGAIDALAAEAPAFAGEINLGTLAAACALGYLDLRFPNDGWRTRHPALAQWFEPLAKRTSMTSTQPQPS